MAQRPKTALLLCLSVFLFCGILHASPSDDYARIISAYESNEYAKVADRAEKFLRTHPKSSLVPEVKLILAEIETDPEKALQKLTDIVAAYPRFKQADYCRYKICEIHYFLSRWEKLEQSAQEGLTKHDSRSRYYSDFLFFRAKAAFYTHNFQESLQTSGTLIRDHKNFHRYPEIKIQTVYALQKVHAEQTDYAQSLKQTYFELKDSGSDISALYLLGRHYEYSHNYNISYSLYADIVQQYPRSPEALLAKKRIAIIRSHNPRYIKNVLSTISAERKNIVQSFSPTRDVEESDTPNYYALTVGPLYNLQSAEKLAGQLQRTFSPVHIVRRHRNFVIYVGRSSSSEGAMSLKIRLAEEYAINSNIVYVRNHDGLNFVNEE